MKKLYHRLFSSDLLGLWVVLLALLLTAQSVFASSVFAHEEIFTPSGDLLSISESGVSFAKKAQPQAVQVNLSQLTPADNTRVVKVIDDHIKPHLKNELKERIGEKLKEVLNKVAMGEPMSPETRSVLTKKCYELLQAQLAPAGIVIQEQTIRATLDKLFLWASKFGVYPNAITVGAMARYQSGLGGSFGYQYNLYLEKGDVKVSSYDIYGVQMGLAQQTKLQFYASLCFGVCFGGDATGFYAGVDGGAGFGMGGNFFIEGGFDLTDMFFHNDGTYSVKDFYQSKAIYVGLGSDIGVGAGVSANIFYYQLDFEKILVPYSSKPKSLKSFEILN